MYNNNNSLKVMECHVHVQNGQVAKTDSQLIQLHMFRSLVTLSIVSFASTIVITQECANVLVT